MAAGARGRRHRQLAPVTRAVADGTQRHHIEQQQQQQRTLPHHCIPYHCTDLAAEWAVLDTVRLTDWEGWSIWLDARSSSGSHRPGVTDFHRSGWGSGCAVLNPILPDVLQCRGWIGVGLRGLRVPHRVGERRIGERCTGTNRALAGQPSGRPFVLSSSRVGSYLPGAKVRFVLAIHRTRQSFCVPFAIENNCIL